VFSSGIVQESQQPSDFPCRIWCRWWEYSGTGPSQMLRSLLLSFNQQSKLAGTTGRWGWENPPGRGVVSHVGEDSLGKLAPRIAIVLL